MAHLEKLLLRCRVPAPVVLGFGRETPLFDGQDEGKTCLGLFPRIGLRAALSVLQDLAWRAAMMR